MKNINEIADEVRDELRAKGIEIEGEDLLRPWGGFFRIAGHSLGRFLSEFFGSAKMPFDVTTLNVSPKILFVCPSKKLSWQVHERRSELWRVVKGPVGIFMSESDIQPAEMNVFEKDSLVELALGTRHRLVGMKDWGIVAEIWIHKYPDNPSDEDDIRRIEDDFGR